MTRLALAAALALTLGASSAEAGVYADSLGKCLVEQTSAQDKEVLVVWIFSAMTWHPKVRDYSTLTDAQRTQFSADTGRLMQRLLVKDCRKDAVAALRYEGGNALEPSFGLLGEVAMGELFKDPKVEAGLSDLAKGIDDAAFEALFKEAGLNKGPTAP